jgi:hypothetical protein
MENSKTTVSPEKKDNCPICKDINYIHIHQGSSGRQIYMIFHTIMARIAIYLSYRCNNKKFNLTSFIIENLFSKKLNLKLTLRKISI